jgi:hypothetical protein
MHERDCIGYGNIAGYSDVKLAIDGNDIWYEYHDGNNQCNERTASGILNIGYTMSR